MRDNWEDVGKNREHTEDEQGHIRQETEGWRKTNIKVERDMEGRDDIQRVGDRWETIDGEWLRSRL